MSNSDEEIDAPPDEDLCSEIAFSKIVNEDAKERAKKIEAELAMAFKDIAQPTEARSIDISNLSPDELSKIILNHPELFKPLIALCAIGGRAFDKDLGIKNVDTYKPKLDQQKAKDISEYLLNLLPEKFLLETIVEVDRVQFIQKEKRAIKGRWEKSIIQALREQSGLNLNSP